ncbi:MAG: barstar family protein [Clostridia bacterium]|nr:barstar family protein [Clostridia bacterium]
MKAVYLDCKDINSTECLQKVLKTMLDFPEYYGYNLDALYDMLTEPEFEAEFHVTNFDALRENLGKYARAFERVLEDSAEENGKFSYYLD